MKKKLIEAIKAKFVGIDDNTSKRLALRAIEKSESITNDDEVAAAVEAITLSDVLKSVNDFSADEAIKRYEEKYNLEKGEKKAVNPKEPAKKSEGDPGVGPKNPEDPMESFKKLFSDFQKDVTTKLQAVSDDVAAMKSGRITETRKAQLDALLKDLKDYQKKPYGRIQVDKMSDDEFGSFLSEVKEEVNDIVAENRASGASVTPALGGKHSPSGPAKEATPAEIDALVSKFPSLT